LAHLEVLVVKLPVCRDLLVAQELRVLLDHKDNLGLPGLLANRVSKDRQDHKDPRDLLDLKDSRDRLDKRDLLETLDKLDHKVSKEEVEQLVHKVTRELSVPLDPLVIKVLPEALA